MADGPRPTAVGLVLHPTKQADQSVDTILTTARDGGVRVLAREVDRQRVPAAVEVVSETDFLAAVAAVVALGGDGTMLGAMRLVIDRPVPVLGVNHGNLGFLVEVTPGELPSALDRLTAGDFDIELHGCLEVGAGDVALAIPIGFNDVVLARSGRAGAISVDLRLNDVRYGYYRADAVVVSTPTGSTAYNYAAGGPILSPSSGAVVITPIAPMSGIGRPIVLGADDTIEFVLATDSAPVAVDVDGIPAGELHHGDRLSARLRRDAAQVVRLSAAQHGSRSRIKLSLLDLPLRQDQLLELIPPELRRNARIAMDRTGGADQPNTAVNG
jgi:NAD+ kinase